MFRIECFVDDKNLAKALFAMQGLALQQPLIQPVVNALVGKNGVKSATPGSVCEMFYDFCRKSKATELSPADVKAWLQSVGREPSSFAYATKCGTTNGFLRRVGKGYKVRYVIQIAKTKKSMKKET